MTSVWPGAAPSTYTGPVAGGVGCPSQSEVNGSGIRAMSRSPPNASCTSIRSSSPGLSRMAGGCAGSKWKKACLADSRFTRRLSAPSSPRARPARAPRPVPSARSLPRATARGSGAMPQFVHGRSRAAGTCSSTRRIVAATSSAVSTRWLATSMTPARTSLPPRSRKQLERHARGRALHARPDRSRLRASSGNVRSYCRHSRPRRGLPVDVGLDPVAVADVDGRLAPDALDRPLERRDPPGLDVGQVGVDVERRLVELDRVDSERRQLPRLGVEGGRHVQGEPRPVSVVRVGHRVDDGHRPGQRPLQPARRARPRERGLLGVDGRRAANGAHDRRHLGDVAVPADADASAAGGVDALETLGEAVHEVTPRLLAVRHDVDPRLLLLAQREQHRVPLPLEERLGREPPRRPQRLRSGQPRRLGKAPRDGRRQHVRPTCSTGRRCGASPPRRRARRPRDSARRARRARTSRG